MKKYISILLGALILLCAQMACAKELSVVATIFPIYDWTSNIIGDAGSAEITLLLDGGVDLHSYQPSVGDIVRIAECDLFIHVGGESDSWVEDVLAQAANKDMKVISLLDALGDGAKEEETVEGMEAEDGDEAADVGPAYDEHVWLSLVSAQRICRAIAGALAELDPANGARYLANAEAYVGKLAALDAKYREAARGGARDTLLFADRFPFRYLVDDLGLKYYAAFAGCSAETEASFETIRFLAVKADELGLPVIMQTESANGRLAETVRQATASKDQRILTLDSMQSASSGGASYLSIMEANLEVLKDALK